ncbi:MAG: DUF4198 domain-containing protein [Arenicella sp.]|nr:DUF4198 domain-containing protein [Arenicella sp.]
MKIVKTSAYFLASLLVLSSSQAFSHSRYIVPSHTSLSGDQPSVVSIDMSISEDIFHADIAFGGKALDNPIPAVEKADNELSADDQRRLIQRRNRFANTTLSVTAPDGSIDTNSPIYNVGRKAVSGFSLTQSGTYRVSVGGEPMIFTRFKKPNGKRGRVFAGKSDLQIPSGSTELKSTKMISRNETFVTRNAISTGALTPFGVGLELDSSVSSHPNDAFVGDAFTVSFLLNGKPLSEPTKVTFTKGQSRYRNQRNAIKLMTDDNGAVQLNWSEPGMYFLEVSVSTESKEAAFDEIRYSYTASFEVFP